MHHCGLVTAWQPCALGKQDAQTSNKKRKNRETEKREAEKQRSRTTETHESKKKLKQFCFIKKTIEEIATLFKFGKSCFFHRFLLVIVSITMIAMLNNKRNDR